MTSPPPLEDTYRGLVVRPEEAVAGATSAGRSRELPASGPYLRFGKQALDRTLSILLLLLFAPLIAVAALAVLVTSGWPVFYAAERVGKDGRSFRMWKLRTMVRDADDERERWQETRPELATEFAREFKLRDDPRVTALGQLLRRSSIDELPQFWNVLRGEMSLVGPRPITAEEVRRYGAHASTLLSLRPGISGRWQTDGRNGVGYPERMWIEIEYCRSPRLMGDIKILFRTLAAPFRYDGR